MRKHIFWLLLAVGLLGLPACNVLELTESGPDACDGAGTLFQDDFSGEQNCGWAEYSRSGAQVEMAEEALTVTTSQPGEIWWTNPGREFNDIIITVDAAQVAGPEDNAYGVICRYQDEGNYYLFLISGDGYYAIGKYQTGSDRITYLTEGEQFLESAAINKGSGALNQLRVGCVGNQLSLAVNGNPLLTVTDPTFVNGDVGLAASTFQPGTAVIEFDNFRVAAP